MAESITFNNATYIIPDVGESNWGQNLTNYFVAIPSGCYQLSGGTSPLTADLSFGSNFGIFAKYLTSVTTTPATAGVVRLAKTDAIEWRNNANGANLALAIDGSDNLLWNGHILATSSTSPVLSIAGTSNEITASAATGNVTLSIPSTLIAPGSIAATTTLSGTAGTLTNTTNQLILGTTNTTTLSATAPAASRTYTIPDAGGAANVVLDAGNYTIAGTWNFSNSITLASSKALILTDNTTNTLTLKATNSTTSWTMALPAGHGSNGQFLQTDGSGNTSWQNGGSGTVQSGTAGNLTLYPSSTASVSDTYVQNTHNITLGIAAQASRSAALAITIPNPGNAITAANVVLDQGAYTIAGALTLSSTLTMSGATIAMGSQKITGLANGTASTDAAAFGQIKYLQAVQATTSTATTTSSATYVDVTSHSVAITPTSSSNRVKVTFSFNSYCSGGGAQGAYYTIIRGSTDLGSTNGFARHYSGITSGPDEATQITISYIDSPATTSSTTYKLQMKCISGSMTAGSTSITSVIMAEEIV